MISKHQKHEMTYTYWGYMFYTTRVKYKNLPLTGYLPKQKSNENTRYWYGIEIHHTEDLVLNIHHFKNKKFAIKTFRHITIAPRYKIIGTAQACAIAERNVCALPFFT